MINLFFFYVITLPVVLCFAFFNYYLFGTKVRYSSTIPASIISIYRSLSGINQTSEYYMEYPIIYMISILSLITYYFYIMFPISIALLVDSFHKTVMDLGSINDTSDDEKPFTFK